MRQLKISKSITLRADISTDKYLSDISKYDLIDILEEEALAKRIKLGDKVALEKLIKANLRFVVSIAKQYQNQWLPLSDLINEGNLWLIKAAERFDETRWFKFISYAVRWIRQSIIQSISNNSNIIRLPLNQTTKKNKINNTESYFYSEYGYLPTLDQLSTLLSLDPKDILHLKNTQKISSYDRSFETESWDIPIINSIEGEFTLNTDHIFNDTDLKKTLRSILSIVSPRNQKILQLTFGLDPNFPSWLSLEEIGKHLNITPERVRQLRDKTIRQLRHNKKFRELLKPYR